MVNMKAYFEKVAGMGHWNNEKVRRLFPSVAWGALCLALVAVSLYVWGKYDAYRLKCEIGVLSDSVDDLHVTLFSVYVVVASAFLALSLAFCGDSLRKLRRARAADAAADVRDESTASALARLDAALNDLHVDVSGNLVSYQGRSWGVSPRVVSFLDILVRKPGHAISLEELNAVFGKEYYDGTESSRSKIRNLKSVTRKELQETPFDIVRDASGNIYRLVLRGE